MTNYKGPRDFNSIILSLTGPSPNGHYRQFGGSIPTHSPSHLECSGTRCSLKQSGGDPYKQKYLKYKQKYLNLKNNM